MMAMQAIEACIAIEVMIHVTSIVLKSWFRQGVIAIALKDDSQALGREVMRRNVRHHLKTEPIRVRGPLHELQRAQLSLSSPRLATPSADRRQRSSSAFAGMRSTYPNF